jgi:uncharacterized RDD family membrane protein YckC
MTSTTPQLEEPGHLPPQVHPFRPAGFFSRLEAFVIDLVILSIVQLVGSAFVHSIIEFFRIAKLATYLRNLLEIPTYNLITGAVITTLFGIAYFIFFWTLVGFTPGKALLGLKIMRRNGAKISFGRSLVRFFAYWISAIPLFLGFLWILWDPKRQSWHDKIVDTQVFYIPRSQYK